MNNARLRVWACVAVAVLGVWSSAALLLLSLACDPGHTLTYRNDTRQTVTVSSDATEIVTLRPQEEKRFSTLEFVGEETFEARDEAGSVVYSETVTWEELKRRGWVIVITEDTLSPTPPSGADIGACKSARGRAIALSGDRLSARASPPA